MTENKRFVIFQDNYDDLHIQDKEVYRATGIKVGNEEDVKYENVSKIVELLNELAEENEQLKQSYKEFEDECQSTFNAMNRKQNDLYRKNFKLKEENEQLKKELSDIDGQLLMLDNCDNWDYDRMKHTVREIAEIIGYNGTINPKR